MFLSLLVSLAFAATPTSTTPSPTPTVMVTPTDEKVVDPKIDPAKATMFVYFANFVGDPVLLEAINNKWAPDGIQIFAGPVITHDKVLAALRAVRGYGHVIVYFELTGVGGDFGDPYLVGYKANPDDASLGLRPSEIMTALQGNQSWVAIISDDIGDGVTPGGQAEIGPSADQWIAAAKPNSNLFVLTAGDTTHPPNEECRANTFGEQLGAGLEQKYASGQDLTGYDLSQLAPHDPSLGVVIAPSQSSTPCNFAPVAKYSGSVTPKTVLLQVSGIMPDPVAVLPPKFTPTVDLVTPMTSVPMTASIDQKPKHTVNKVMLGVGGAFALGSVATGIVYANQKKTTDEEFSDANVRSNFANEEEAQQAAIVAGGKLTIDRNTTIGLAGCAAILVAGGTITWLF